MNVFSITKKDKNSAGIFFDMKIIDEFLISVRHSGPVGEPLLQPSVSDKPVCNLLALLSQSGFPIKDHDSEVFFCYAIRGVTKSSVMPLKMLSDQAVTKYVLRGSGLEVSLENYSNILERPPAGVIGGTIIRDAGILCRIEKETEQPEELKKLRTVIEEFYRPIIHHLYYARPLGME